MYEDFRQIKTGKDNYEVITEETINRIAKIKVFESSKMNSLLYEMHKKLLKIAQKNKNKEVGMFWDLNNIERTPLVIIGEKNGINIRQDEEINNMVRNTNTCKNVVIMHNHPRNGLFSSQDIQSFIDFNAIYIMTAVCNDGTIYMMRKDFNFNPLLMQKYYNQGKERSQREALEERIKKAKKLGVNVKDLVNVQTKPYYYGIKNIAKHAKEIGITYRCSVKRKEI